MNSAVKSKFFSIQPFWVSGKFNKESYVQGKFFVGSFSCKQSDLLCVPGNGQIGINLQGPENFDGYCFGVLDKMDRVPVLTPGTGKYIHFSPGVFSEIFKIPASEIAAHGVSVLDILPRSCLNKLQTAMASEDPNEELIKVIGEFYENAVSPYSAANLMLANNAIDMIVDSRGSIQMNQLSEELLYSSRRIQSIVGQQVGISPKQLCKQIRFQNALRMLHAGAEINLSELAYTLGYSDQAHFCREFKCFTGMKPTEYLRQCNQSVTTASN